MRQLLGGRNFIKKRVGLHQSRAFRRVVLGVMPIFCLAFLTAFLAASIFAPINTSNAAEITTINASVAYGTYSLSLETDPGVTLALNAGSNGAMTVGTSNLSISTTAPSGYKLYLGMTGTNANTNSLISGSDQITSTGTIGAPIPLTNGTWGYAIPSGSIEIANGFDASYTTFTSGVPTTNKFAAVPAGENNSVLIDRTNKANDSVKVIPVYYGVRAGFETPTGSYTNKILYTAVADVGSTDDLFVYPATASSNNVSSTSPLTLTMSLLTTSDVTVDAYMLTEAQYNSGSPDLSSLSGAKMSCTRNTELDILQLSCTTPENTEGTYYVYVNIPYYDIHYAKEFHYVADTFWSISSMQQMTHALCASVTTPSASATLTDTTGAHHGENTYVPQRTLYDVRDQEFYTIRKLADGNCWMTENLRLAGPKTLTAADSNVSSDFNLLAPTSFDTAWCTTNDSACDDQSMSIDSGNTDYGFYYNWYAATAGTGLYDTASGDASSSICPKNWRLPKGGSSGDFQTLYSQYNSVDKMRSNGDYADLKGPAFVLSGYRVGSSTSGQGSYGFYWSGTARDSNYAYRLYLDNSDVGSASNNLKYYGFSVRCVVQ